MYPGAYYYADPVHDAWMLRHPYYNGRIFVGRSPSGVEWWATPETLSRMRQRYHEVWGF